MRRYIILFLITCTVWAQDCTADDGTDGIELWGECYSIENTTEISINGWITGEIPPEIGNLANLESLSIFNNDELTGPIPSEIGNLSNLNLLNLRFNQLTGLIPSQIGNLSNLDYLDLGFNQFTGSIPSEIGNLVNLSALDLRGNQLTGSIPSEIGNLVNLSELGLGENQLSGIIPEEICNQGDATPNLEYNQLCPPYPSCIENYVGEQNPCSCDVELNIVELWGECYSSEYTTEINLYNSGLAGNIPPEIGQLSNLTYLNLDFNELFGTIPSEIGNLTNLNRLQLMGNQITGTIPSEIGNLTNLTRLWIQGNQLSGVVPESICDLNINWSSSFSFRIYNNELCPPYPPCIEDEMGEQDTLQCPNCIAEDDTDGIELWNECYSIENTLNLDLSNTELSDTIPIKIAGLNNLEILNLSSNQLTGEIPLEIGRLDRLTSLYLNDNQLTGFIPFELGNLTNLNSLRLNDNQLSGWFPSTMCNLPIEFDGTIVDSMNLPYFDISNNQLCPPYASCIENHAGFQDTSNCTQLFTCTADDGTDGITIWGNCYSIENTTSIERWMGGLEGIIPPIIGDLYNLEFLDLWTNNLVGEIPSTLGNLTNLNYLSLGRNQLSGEIPSEIYSLTNLETFHIQENNITGEISPQIGNLVNLTWIMFNDNQLSGEIPSEISNIQNDGINPGGGIHLQLHNNLLSGLIPESICDMNLAYGEFEDEHHGFKIYGNFFCPPYPDCLIEYIGEQDTINCNPLSKVDDLIPNAYQLYNAYPNPFNPITNLRYELAEDLFVRITIYDILGNVVKNLVNTYQSSGYKSVEWNATNNQGKPVSAGVYLYSFDAGDFRETKKMILLK